MSPLPNIKHWTAHKEDIYSTIRNEHENPFWLTAVGHTYPDPLYQEIRLDCAIGCVEYIISGSGIIITDGQIHVVNEGDTYLLLPHQDHNYYSDCNNPMEKIWFNFKGPLAESIINLYGLKKIHVFKNVDSSKYIYEMHQAASCSGNSKTIQDVSSLTFLKTIQFLSECTVSDYQPELSLAENIRIYLDNHLLDEVNLQELASSYDRSYDYIIRTFKKAHGITPHQYILQSKIKLAASVLASTHQPIKTVAAIVHLDEKEFSKYFKRVYNSTPVQFRNNLLRQMEETFTPPEKLTNEIEQ